MDKANACFVDENFEEALAQYTEVIEAKQSDATVADALAKRAACHLKLESPMDALTDAKNALALDAQHAGALLRKGEALFELGEFESALAAFEEGAKVSGGGNKWTLWVGKCKAELKEEGQGAAEPKKSEPVAAEVKAPAAPKIRHEWYQTDSNVIVTVFCKGLRAEQVEKTISAHEYTLSLKLDDSTEWQQHMELFGEVVPDASSLVIMSTKLELSLKKKTAVRWSTLERQEGQTPLAPGVLLDSVPPTSKKVEPYASKKKVNWDKFIAEQDDLDDDDPLNKVFKDIYGKGSSEQQRAMMKSYVESGGTVLSTNWEDVGSKKVEVSPPDGMVAKKWSTDEVIAEGGKDKVERK